MKLALDALGKDSVMYLYGDAPLPREYAFMPLDGLRRELPADAAERVLRRARLRERVADRGRCRRCSSRRRSTLDIDHHHDNTRFGDVNLIVGDASSTGEVLRDVFAELGVELTPEIAEALYVALVTDTGRFQYSNTTPKALRLGRRAGRGRRRRPPRLPGRLRVGRVREAEAARARARAGAGLRGRAARRLVPPARATSRSSARPRRTRRGSSTTCARSRAPTWRR